MWPKNWKINALIAIVLVSSTLAVLEYRRVNVLNDRLDCAAFWLDKAKSLHQAQMSGPGAFTGESMRELMNSVDGAYDCATKGPVAGHAPDAARSFGQ